MRPGSSTKVVYNAPASQPAGASSATEEGEEPSSQPASQPSPEQRLEELKRLIMEELAHPDLDRARAAVLVSTIGEGEVLVSHRSDAHMVPASNAKLLTSTAAVLSLSGRYAFVTEVSRRAGGRLYLWSNGVPVLRGRDLDRMARAIRAKGVSRVRGIVIDDSYYSRRRLAPGFEAFSEGSYYRPTSGALNVDGNAVVIKVSAPQGRKRPRVDVFPPSDYVKVRKLVRFHRCRRRRGRRPACSKKTKIKVQIRPRGSIMWVTVSGLMRQGGRTWTTKRAVYDPGLNAGWALRRALVKAGVSVEGIVSRGRRPKAATLLVRRRESMARILRAVNTDSDNLAAENLVRAMGSLTLPDSMARGLDKKRRRARGSWKLGLERLKHALETLGLKEFWLGNGSGLHRGSWVTAQTLVTLLRKIATDKILRRAILPTMAVAGRSGTLARRLRGTAAEEVVLAKTGTLGGALALSGFIDPDGDRALAFSIVVNGRGDRRARGRIDRITALLARYTRALPLEAPEEPASVPTTAPTSAPTTLPSSQPASVPAPAPASQPASPATQPATQPSGPG